MQIYEKIPKECCAIDLKATKKQAALKELTKLLKNSPLLSSIDEQTIFDSLARREELGSTGLGRGIAIPHTKIEGLTEFVIAVATSEKGVQFDAVDNKKVHIFFIMIGPPDRPDEHLKLLSAISLLLRDEKIKSELRRARTPEALYETIVMTSREGIEKPTPTEKQKLLMIVLYEQQFLDDILELFIELGIRGSTVIDSIGMGGILTKVPLFADFINFLGKNKNYSKTILACVSESELEAVTRGVNNIMGNLDTHGGAAIMSLNLDFMKGSMEYL
jgi:mannitol/fructose-specific phosphotransferase system IIA component (Ntr-type)